MKIRFLLDENLSPRIKIALLRLDPTIDVLRVGDPNAPELGTSDPDILRYLSITQRLLVTDNRNSMPEHLANHSVYGEQTWGIFLVRPKTSMGRLAQELHLIWEASNAEEWIDTIDWIPL